MYIRKQFTSPYLKALLKGRVVLCRPSSFFRIPSSSPKAESQALWRRKTELFLHEPHLPREGGSLWIGDGPTPQHHLDKPQPPGSCRAAKLQYPS